MKIAGVILAAGFSRRLGRPKQEILLGGETLLVRAVRAAVAAGLEPVLAVVRNKTWVPMLEPHGACVLMNAGAEEGMASSLRVAVHALVPKEIAGVVMLTCDQPLLRPEHLKRLCAEPGRVTASGYAGRRGVPAYFPAEVFPALLALQGDAGARVLLQDAATVFEEDLALDIDTEDDLRRAERRFALDDL